MVIAAIRTGVTAIVSIQRQVAEIAQDVANISSTGYRSSRSSLTALPNQAGVTTARARLGGGGAGRVVPGDTGAVTVQNGAFLQVETAGGEALLASSARLVLDGKGFLRTATGLYVLDEGGARISVNSPQGGFSVARDGTIRAGGDNGAVVGRLALVRVTAPNGLVPHGGGAYRAGSESGPALSVPDGTRSVLVGFLDQGGSVDPVEALVRLASARLAFSANLRSIEAAGEIADRTINLLR